MRIVIDIDDATFTAAGSERARVARYVRNVAQAIECGHTDDGLVSLTANTDPVAPHLAGWAVDDPPWRAVEAPGSHQETRS